MASSFDFPRGGDNKIPIFRRIGAHHVSNLTIISEDGAIKFQSASSVARERKEGTEGGRGEGEGEREL